MVCPVAEDVITDVTVRILEVETCSGQTEQGSSEDNGVSYILFIDQQSRSFLIIVKPTDAEPTTVIL